MRNYTFLSVISAVFLGISLSATFFLMVFYSFPGLFPATPVELVKSRFGWAAFVTLMCAVMFTTCVWFSSVKTKK